MTIKVISLFGSACVSALTLFGVALSVSESDPASVPPLAVYRQSGERIESPITATLATTAVLTRTPLACENCARLEHERAVLEGRLAVSDIVFRSQNRDALELRARLTAANDSLQVYRTLVNPLTASLIESEEVKNLSSNERIRLRQIIDALGEFPMLSEVRRFAQIENEFGEKLAACKKDFDAGLETGLSGSQEWTDFLERRKAIDAERTQALEDLFGAERACKLKDPDGSIGVIVGLIAGMSYLDHSGDPKTTQ